MALPSTGQRGPLAGAHSRRHGRFRPELEMPLRPNLTAGHRRRGASLGVTNQTARTVRSPKPDAGAKPTPHPRG